jgi:hypothetical protein
MMNIESNATVNMPELSNDSHEVTNNTLGQNSKGEYIMKNSIASVLNDVTLVNQETFEFVHWVAAASSLKRRMDMQIPKLKFLEKENLIDSENMYMFFRNNKAPQGGTYDDTRLTTIAENPNDEEYKGGICFQTWGSIEGGTAYFFTYDDTKAVDEKVTKYTFDDWKEMKKQLKDDEELRTMFRSHFNPNYIEPEIEEVVEKPVKATKTAKPKKEKVKVESPIYASESDDDIPAKRTRKKAAVKEEIVNEEDVIV